MPSDPPSPLFAGGLLILAGFLLGSVVGILRGEPSLGAIVGTMAGAGIALVLWLRARRRAG